MNEQTKQRQKKSGLYRNAVQLVVVGGVTGIFSGSVVTVYNICAEFGADTSKNIYALLRQNPAFIPLLFVVLALGAFFLSVAVRLVPMVKGSGIPQTEGATRGVLHFRWYRDAATMFAMSLLSIFMGLSAGSEGPSLEIGGACGDGVAKVLRRNEMIRRYQVTGGACTGLAVAFNAPLTGMAFAFEEAHRRFTPEVFICAFSSVITGLLTRSGLYAAFHLQADSTFQTYQFSRLPVLDYGYVVVAAVICGLLGVAFYRLVFLFRTLFGKIELKNRVVSDWLKMFVAVAIGGIFSLVTVNVMGGGHGLIESLGTLGGTQEQTTESIFSLSIVATLAVVLVLKFLITCINIGAGVPCGAFIPMLAIGACVGALLNRLWLKLGLDPQYADLLVMICMAAFFTSVVKAPITGIVMVCELTWSFAPLLPVIIGVSIGYIIADVARTDSIYEKLLNLFEKETGVKERARREVFTVTVRPLCIADGRAVRDILWPSGAVVTDLKRGETKIHPDGDTVLIGGDELTIVCHTEFPKIVKDDLEHITGN
jgi:H+/Cl- antiporter ClcA